MRVYGSLAERTHYNERDVCGTLPSWISLSIPVLHVRTFLNCTLTNVRICQVFLFLSVVFAVIIEWSNSILSILIFRVSGYCYQCLRATHNHSLRWINSSKIVYRSNGGTARGSVHVRENVTVFFSRSGAPRPGCLRDQYR